MAGRRRQGRVPPQALPPIPPSHIPTPGVRQQPITTVAKTRRELRAERRRQQRRRLGAVGIAAVVVAGLAVAAAIGFGVHKATSGGHKDVRSQTTLLLSIVGSDGTATETALLAHDSKTHHGVELLIPARVLTEVCGFGNQQLGQILALPNGQALSRSTVSTLLGGVTVDGSWVLTSSELARLVDAVGGITVNVDVNVIQGRSVIVAKGDNQHLNGARAAAFATYLAGGEEALDNLVRLQAVLDGIEAALPRDAAGVENVIRKLGPDAQSSLGASRLSDLLVGVASDARQNNLLPTALPVVKIDAGSSQPAYRIDSTQTTSFVRSNLAGSLPAAARAPRKRVFVQNGVGTPGLAVTACDRLVKAGFAFAGSGNAPRFGYPTSKVLVFDRSVASAEVGNSVAHALGLPLSDVAVSSTGQNVADVLVILGKDYKR